MLRSNAGRDWSQCVIDYLDNLPHRYVLIMLDDFFLRRQVPTSTILNCLEFALAAQATQLRLIPRPRPTDHLRGEKLIGSSAAGSPYRLSTQAAIWDRKKLRALLRPGETIWEFERNGNARAALHAGGYYSVKNSVLPYEDFWTHHVVEKGKWLPQQKRIFARLNIGCDFSKRETLPWTEVAFLHLVQIIDALLQVLPWRTSIRVKRVLKFMLRPFFRNALDKLGQTPSASRPNS